MLRAFPHDYQISRQYTNFDFPLQNIYAIRSANIGNVNVMPEPPATRTTVEEPARSGGHPYGPSISAEIDDTPVSTYCFSLLVSPSLAYLSVS